MTYHIDLLFEENFDNGFADKIILSEDNVVQVKTYKHSGINQREYPMILSALQNLIPKNRCILTIKKSYLQREVDINFIGKTIRFCLMRKDFEHCHQFISELIKLN